MENCSIYIITCDKTNWVLNITIPLLEKYWDIEKNVKILGFAQPNIKLPSDYEFISMQLKQESIDNWAYDIYSVMKNDPNEYIIFMLDDFLPLDYVDSEMLRIYFNKMNQDRKVVRCALGSDMQFLPHDIVERHEEYDIIELKQISLYRITTQPSIWRKEYILKYLEKSKNPWHFETAISPADGNRMISTIRKYSYCCMCESAVSGRYPGKFNVLGLRIKDLKNFVDDGLLKEDDLQFGMHLGDAPSFKKYGYDFKLDDLKKHVNNKKFNEYYIRYNHIYE